MQGSTTEAVDSMGELLGNMTVYKRVGTDTDGRTHHYDPGYHQIVVCRSDRVGGIADEDIVERIDIPEWSSGAWDYVAYVRDETDTEWESIDVPETEQ